MKKPYPLRLTDRQKQIADEKAKKLEMNFAEYIRYLIEMDNRESKKD